MSTQPKVLIVGAYVRENAGDAALLRALLAQVERAFPGCVVKISGMEDARVHPHFHGVPNLGSMRRYVHEGVPQLRRAARKALVATVGLVWFVGSARWYGLIAKLLPAEVREELSGIEEADLLVSLVGAGPYLQGASQPGLGTGIVYQMLPLVLAQRLGKPVVFTPQSYGPFGSGTGWWTRLVTQTLGRARLVLVREDISLAELDKLALPPGIAQRSVDLAFTLDMTVRPVGNRTWRSIHGISEDETLVGLTVRRCLPEAEQERYEAELADFVDRVHEIPGHRVVLFPLATGIDGRDDDRVVCRAVASRCRGERRPILLDTDDGYRCATSFVAELDYLIGTRFHSVIFALTVYIPCIAIEYEHKTRGIMRDLGLEEWVIQAREVSAAGLVDLLVRLETHRLEYLARLGRILPTYAEQGHLVADALVRAFDGKPHV
jgi:colanic acid/amylovoran biosynthesis protein